jgi:hypothetical protein
MSRPLNNLPGGLAALAPEDVVLSALAVKSGKRSLKQFLGDIKSFISHEDAQAVLQDLICDGRAREASGKVALTPEGAKDVEGRFGKPLGGKEAIDRLSKTVWCALVLGIDPKSKAASRLATSDKLRAVTITALFGLPIDREKATMAAVNAALILRGMAGLASAVADPRIAAIAQTAGDLSKKGALEKTLVKAGLALAAGRKLARTDDDLAAFARQVQAVADRLSTPPFSQEVAIGQVYDVYGRDYPNAGTLEHFKARLVDANRARLLVLYRLDDPGALDAGLRDRSLIETPGGRYHFVARS